MADFTEMPRVAKAYWLLVIAAGCSCLVRSLAGWQAGEESLLKLAIYVVAGVFAADLKIRLPGIFGTLSMNYVVIIVALQDLSLGAAVIVGTVEHAEQCLIHASARPKWFQVLFSVAGIPIPVMAAHIALKSRRLLRLDHTGYIALLAASMAYFVDEHGDCGGHYQLHDRQADIRNVAEFISLDLTSVPCGRRVSRARPTISALTGDGPRC